MRLCVGVQKLVSLPYLFVLLISSSFLRHCDTKETCVFGWKTTSGMFPKHSARTKKGRNKINLAHRYAPLGVLCREAEQRRLFALSRFLTPNSGAFSPRLCDPPEWLIWVRAVSSVCLWAYVWVLFSFCLFFSLKDVTFALPEKQMFALERDYNFSFLHWLSNFG